MKISSVFAARVFLCALLIPLVFLANPGLSRSQDEPAAAPAQEAPKTDAEKPSDNLPDITVSATKTAREVDLTPGEVNVVTKDELDFHQVRDLRDVFKYEPGVEFGGSTQFFRQRPNVRGLSGPRVLVQIDGARMNFDSGHKGQVFYEPEWIRRVEVVRGPSSALYGSSGLGGVLDMRTILPSDYLGSDDLFGVRLKAGVATANDELQFTPTLYGRLGREGVGKKVEYLFSYTTRNGDDIEPGRGRTTIPNSDEDLDSFLGKFVINATDNDTITLSAMQFTDEGELPTPSVVETDIEQSTYRIAWQHRDPERNLFNLDAGVYWTRMDVSEDTPAINQEDDFDFATTGFDIRNRSVFDFDRHSLAVTFGMEYFTDEQDVERNGGPNLFFPKGDNKHVAGYVELELSLFDDLLLIMPGGRYDSVDIDGEGGLNNDDSSFSPKIGALLKLDDEIGLKEGDYFIVEGSYSRGFRSPTFAELFISGTHFPGAIFTPNADLDPETSRNAEIGARAKFRDLHLRGAYFQNKAKDFIDYDVSFTPPFGPLVFTPYNADEVKIRGYEFEASWDFMDYWTLWGNYTHIRGDNETTDEPLSSIFPDKGVVGLDFRHEGWGLTAGPRIRMVDEQDRVPTGGLESHGYTVYDFALSWEPQVGPDWFRDFRFDAAIDNITDKGYEPYLTGISDPGVNVKLAVTYTKNF